eukprot:1195233-Pyramimonas_sp.AAC.2
MVSCVSYRYRSAVLVLSQREGSAPARCTPQGSPWRSPFCPIVAPADPVHQREGLSPSVSHCFVFRALLCGVCGIYGTIVGHGRTSRKPKDAEAEFIKVKGVEQSPPAPAQPPSQVCRARTAPRLHTRGTAWDFWPVAHSPTDQSQSINRNIPHPTTNHSPSIGIYDTHRSTTLSWQLSTTQYPLALIRAS